MLSDRTFGSSLPATLSRISLSATANSSLFNAPVPRISARSLFAHQLPLSPSRITRLTRPAREHQSVAHFVRRSPPPPLPP